MPNCSNLGIYALALEVQAKQMFTDYNNQST